MFLAAYHFEGDHPALLAAYDRLLDSYPPESLLLHACVTRDGGITVFDACPSREVHEAFSRSPEFAGALAAAGLPTPRVEPLGDVHAAIAPSGARS